MIIWIIPRFTAYLYIHRLDKRHTYTYILIAYILFSIHTYLFRFWIFEYAIYTFIHIIFCTVYMYSVTVPYYYINQRIWVGR